jgi:hypothetical protein
MRDPPGAKAWLGEGSSGAHDDGGGSARRRIAGAHVPATRASGDGRCSRGGLMQTSPGFWSPWVDSWRSCEGSMGVREVRESPAARNRKGGVGYRRRSSGSIPAR